MNLYDQIFHDLQRRNNAELREMASRSGLHWISLYKIRSGNLVNPTWNTLYRLQRLLGLRDPVRGKRRRSFPTAGRR